MTDMPTVNPFTFVRIPAVESAAVEEERFLGSSEAELRAHLTRYFRQGLLSEPQKREMAAHLLAKSTEQVEKQAARAAALKQATAASNDEKEEKEKEPELSTALDPAQQQKLIDGYLEDTSYEIVPIMMPMRNTGFIGTSLYIDDSGAFKELPLNTRASKIAQRDIRGDAFLLSNHDDPALDEWGRVDCPLDRYEQLLAKPPTSGYDTSNQAQMTQAALLRENDTKKISPEDAAAAVAGRAEGNRLFAAGDTAGAIAAYTTAVDLSEGRRDLLPSEAELTAVHLAALLNRSLCLAKEKRFAEAARDARRALALEPASQKAHYRLAQALISQQEFQPAEDAVTDFVRCGGAEAEAVALREAIVAGGQRYREQQKKQFAKMFS